MDFEFLLDGSRQVISLEKKEGRLIIRLGKTLLEAEVETLDDGTVSFLVGKSLHLAHLGRDRTRILVSIGGKKVVLLRPGREGSRSERGEEAGQMGISLVKAPMPGRVIKLPVAQGDVVRKNQTLAIVEAMKMENEIKSPHEAKVGRIFAAVGELVDSDRPLIELEPLA
jgi:acetyl/propionyl-CoA carboxylase alpha subunit